jgi:signal transduction histidine kinase
VLALFRSRITAADIELHREYERTEPLVCLAGDIRQALGNVIANAIDASPEGGKLQVRLRSRRRFANRERLGIRITVADKGCGIDAENRRHVFEPFFTTKGMTGTGLGLWVARDLIAKHDGAISIRSSTTPGNSGTVVSIFLPYEAVKG